MTFIEPVDLAGAAIGIALTSLAWLGGHAPEAREMAPVVPAPRIVTPEYVTPESTMPIAPPQTWTYGPGVDPEAVTR